MANRSADMYMQNFIDIYNLKEMSVLCLEICNSDIFNGLVRIKQKMEPEVSNKTSQ